MYASVSWPGLPLRTEADAQLQSQPLPEQDGGAAVCGTGTTVLLTEYVMIGMESGVNKAFKCHLSFSIEVSLKYHLEFGKGLKICLY